MRDPKLAHILVLHFKACGQNVYWGGPTLFLSVDFVNILPKKGGGQTLMSTKALTKY